VKLAVISGKKVYLKTKTKELETNSKIKNIRDLYRGIIDSKRGYQPRTNIVKYEKSDLVANLLSSLDRWRSGDQKAGRSHNIKIDNILFESMEGFKYLGTILIYQNSTREVIKSILKSRIAYYN